MIELDKRDMDDFAAFHAQSAPVTIENAAARLRRQDKVLVLLFGIFLLLLLGILLLAAIPAVAAVLGFLGLNLAFVQELNAWWFAERHGLWWIAGLGLLALLTGLLGRYRILNNPSLYYEAGCPRCQEHDLFRVSRYRRDHLLAAFGFPTRRYACRNCTWQGTRLAGMSSDLYARLPQNHDEQYPY